MENDFNEYVYKRLDNIINNKQFIELTNNFLDVYKEIYSSFSVDQQKNLDRLFETFDDISFEKQCIIYKAGFVDGINLNSDIYKNS